MQPIKLTQGKVAFVNNKDLQRCNDYGPWYYTAYGYAATKLGSKTIYLHNFITGQTNIDHRNRDKLDCRKSNLRLATQSQNLANTTKRQGSSKFKGVCWDKQNKCWRASIKVRYKQLHLGLFEDEIKAAKAYDEAAIKYFGKFAVLNLR